jgi:hypothetical protein
MKRSLASLLAIFAIATAHAGSFGGPPPFSNGSPLQSGIDGSYQAAVRGNNLSGVVRFSYSGQVQTSTTSSNGWAIFYEGQLYTGRTETSIANNKISGVLSRTTGLISPTTTTTTAANDLIQGQNLSGYFNAKLQSNSPTGSFKGNGELQVTLPPLYTYNETNPTVPGTPTLANGFTQTPTTGQAQGFTESATQGVPDPSNPAATAPGHLTSAPFKISGVRASTTGS